LNQKRKFPSSEQKTLLILDEIVRQKSVRAVIDSIIPRVERKFETDSESLLAWEPVPLDIYGEGLPDKIRSSWVFIVCALTNSGAERHPNSHQYMMSYRGSGDLQVMIGERWDSNPLISDSGVEIENKWISIPPNTWHRVVTSKENWVVVSFHTVPESELIEERPDPSDTQITRQRLYLDEEKP
jgi:hypothetical protein